MAGYAQAPDLNPSDYVVLGLATCFVKVEGEVRQLEIVEPIPSAALAALQKQIPTSYRFAYATCLGQVLAEDGSPMLPAAIFPPTAQLCHDFCDRAIAATRTYKHQASQPIPPGEFERGLNYSLERKRVLNADRAVREEDNVKQHEYTHKVL